MTKQLIVGLALCLSVYSQSHAQDNAATAQARKVNYLVTIDSDIKMKKAGKTNALKVRTRVHYSNIQLSEKIEVRLKKLWVQSDANKREVIFFELSKDVLKIRDAGELIEIKPGEEEELNEVFASFSKPAGTVTLDKNGAEVSRQASQEDNDFIGFNSILRNTRWFHPRHPIEKTWTETREFDMGEGRSIKGPITFTKLNKKNAKGHTEIKLSGIMTKKAAKTETATYSNVKYVFEGSQSFDEKRKIWVNGITKVKFSCQVLTAKGLFDTSGTMHLKLKIEKPGEKDTKPLKAADPQKKPGQNTKAKKSTYSYKMRLKTDLTLVVGKQQIHLSTPSQFSYQNTVSNDKRIVQLNEIVVSIVNNKKQTMYIKMNKDVYKAREGEKKHDFTYENASEIIRDILYSMFRVPIATITVDKTGRELKRKLAKDSRSPVKLSGMILNVRWFHAPFLDKKTWTETRTFDMGKGGGLTGPLTFTKQDKKDAQGNTVVKVTGTIKKDKAQTQRGTLSNIVYVFEGTQSFDEKRKIWVSGITKVNVAYEMKTTTFTMKTTGTMTLKLSMAKAK
ncbi:MAG: hypothetical protein P1V97_33175 [Planctomycetota bacterium]|nr:hypothetical protein [Planctomycetota bacterium]